MNDPLNQVLDLLADKVAQRLGGTPPAQAAQQVTHQAAAATLAGQVPPPPGAVRQQLPPALTPGQVAPAATGGAVNPSEAGLVAGAVADQWLAEVTRMGTILIPNADTGALRQDLLNLVAGHLGAGHEELITRGVNGQWALVPAQVSQFFGAHSEEFRAALERHPHLCNPQAQQ